MYLYYTYETHEGCKVYTRAEMQQIYDTEVDKTEWDDFKAWLFDICRSGVFEKVHVTPDTLKVLELVLTDVEEIRDEFFTKCYVCGKTSLEDRVNYKPLTDEYICPECGTVQNALDFDSVGLWDYVKSKYFK